MVIVRKFMYSSNLPPNKHKNTGEYFVTWNIEFIKDGNEVPNECFENEQNIQDPILSKILKIIART